MPSGIRGRLGWALAGGLVAVLLAAMGWGIAHPALRPAGVLVGSPAPDLVVTSLAGERIRLSTLRGRPVVLNFWASWCPPCRQEAAALDAAALRHGNSVWFLGVDIQDTVSAAAAYERQVNDPYPVGPAAEGGAADYGVTSPPETFFITPTGVVAAHVIGPVDDASLARYVTMITA